MSESKQQPVLIRPDVRALIDRMAEVTDPQTIDALEAVLNCFQGLHEELESLKERVSILEARK